MDTIDLGKCSKSCAPGLRKGGKHINFRKSVPTNKPTDDRKRHNDLVECEGFYHQLQER